MPYTILNQANDADLRQAYQARFRVNTGDVLSSSQKAADHLSTYLNGRTREAFCVIYLNARNDRAGMTAGRTPRTTRTTSRRCWRIFRRYENAAAISPRCHSRLKSRS